MKKIVIILILWFSCCSIILYFLYMNRVENAFGNIKEETKNSMVLEKKLGKIILRVFLWGTLSEI